MTIYVDPLLYYSNKPFKHHYWCHMTSDESIEELTKFAISIGLKSQWFQNHPRIPHYDLTSNKRNKAISCGAVSVTHEEFIKLRMKK